MSIRFLTFIFTILLINNLYAFDLFGSVSNTFSRIRSATKDVANNSLNYKSLKDSKKEVSLSDLLHVDLKKIIDANVINIPGLFGLHLQCGIDKKIPIYDICNYLKPATSKLKINMGICQADMTISSACIVNLAKKMCKKEKKKLLESPIKTIRSGYKYLKTTGTLFIKKHSWSSTCELLFSKKKKKVLKNPNGVSEERIEKFYFTPAIINTYGLNSVNAQSIYDSNLLDWKRCIRLNAKKRNPFYALKKCSKLYKEQMPKTEYDVDNYIGDTLPFIDEGINDILDNSFDNILIFQANYAKICGNSKDPVRCQNLLWEKGTFKRADGVTLSPKKLYNEKLLKIEKANARFYSILKEATRKKKEMIFLSQDFINTLPIKERREYLRKAKKEMYQRILNRYFLQQITKNEEELVSIEYDSEKIASTIFYPKQALNEINTLINSLNKQ